MRAAVRRGGRSRRWFYGAVGAAVAAAITLVVFVTGNERAGATRFPAPSVALLKAQTEVAARGKSIDSLGAEMRTYRTQMFAALAERYREAR